MHIESFSGARKAIRRKLGTFQRTFHTPSDRLPAFTEAVLADVPHLRSGQVVVQAVVFEPTHLISLLERFDLEPDHIRSTITANGTEECRSLLEAALRDSIDFYFLPDPKLFALFADHDEYVTIFSHRKGSLSKICGQLLETGFDEIADYVRSF